MILILYLCAMTELILTDKSSDTLKMSQEIRSIRAALFYKNDVLYTSQIS